MVNMTISIPAALKTRMDRDAATSWSAVAREAFESRLRDTQQLQELQGKRTHLTLAELQKTMKRVSDEDATALVRKMRTKKYR
ncbi:MAG: hypothetical protein OXR66_00245 [Candidatus Woesearchaeota archaeon]|nr:hypothetical protein [Candidatus Woesearchaeota archaeon]